MRVIIFMLFLTKILLAQVHDCRSLMETFASLVEDFGQGERVLFSQRNQDLKVNNFACGPSCLINVTQSILRFKGRPLLDPDKAIKTLYEAFPKAKEGLTSRDIARAAEIMIKQHLNGLDVRYKVNALKLQGLQLGKNVFAIEDLVAADNFVCRANEIKIISFLTLSPQRDSVNGHIGVLEKYEMIDGRAVVSISDPKTPQLVDKYEISLITVNGSMLTYSMELQELCDYECYGVGSNIVKPIILVNAITTFTVP